MKTLIVYDKQGNIIFTQTNATADYACLVEDVADNKEVVSVDIKTNKFILADRLATTEEKEQLKLQLEETKQELLDTQASLVDSTYNNLLKENGGM